MSTTNKNKRLGVITALFFWCILLIYVRAQHSGTSYFIFLWWNLFLAFVPLLASSAFQAINPKRRPVGAAVLLILWLLFLPNAFYILTDLIHLAERPPVPLWYDLAVILSCAGTGLLLGYLSLIDVHATIEKSFGSTAGWAIATGSLLVSGFGLYLGRFLRWNSWEALTNPHGLAIDVTSRVTSLHSLILTLGVTAVFGIGLLLGYAALRVIAASITAVEPKIESFSL